MPWSYIPDPPNNTQPPPYYPQFPVTIPPAKKGKRGRKASPMKDFMDGLREQDELNKALITFFKDKEEKNKPKEDKKKPLVEFSPVQLATMLTVGGMVSIPFFVYSLGYAFASAINSIQMAIHH